MQQAVKTVFGTDLQILASDIKDIPEIIKIERESFSDPWSSKAFEDTLTYSYATMLTAKVKDQVAGYCCLYHILDEGEIVNVAIAPQFRRTGIGMNMLTCLIERGKMLGVRRFVLDVRVSNVCAIGLYEKAGFKKLVIQKNFYECPPEDAWLMELV